MGARRAVIGPGRGRGQFGPAEIPGVAQGRIPDAAVASAGGGVKSRECGGVIAHPVFAAQTVEIGTGTAHRDAVRRAS